MTVCVICDKDFKKVWYSGALFFGGYGYINTGPWCNTCRPRNRGPIGRARYALKVMIYNQRERQ